MAVRCAVIFNKHENTTRYLWNSFAKIPNRSVCFMSIHVPRFVALEFANQAISRESNPQKKTHASSRKYSPTLSAGVWLAQEGHGQNRQIIMIDYDRLLCCWLRPSHHKGHLCWLMHRRRQHHGYTVQSEKKENLEEQGSVQK